MTEINNLTTNPVDEEFLKRVAKKVLAGENKKEESLSIVLVGQGRMRKLNKRYLRRNRTTDVLAFSDKGFGLPDRHSPETKPTAGGGEIVICLREVKKNAKRFNLPSQTLRGKTWEGEAFEKEMARVLIHGILHLLGHDHEKSEEAAKKMEEKQNCYLEKLF